jgi:hypothetical protein
MALAMSVCQFLKIHGSESKHRVRGNFFKPSELRPTHTMLFFCISEDTFNRFFTLCIYFFIFLRMTKEIGFLQVIFPDMSVDHLDVLFYSAYTERTTDTVCTLKDWKRIDDSPRGSLFYRVRFLLAGICIDRNVHRKHTRTSSCILLWFSVVRKA